MKVEMAFYKDLNKINPLSIEGEHTCSMVIFTFESHHLEQMWQWLDLSTFQKRLLLSGI